MGFVEDSVLQDVRTAPEALRLGSITCMRESLGELAVHELLPLWVNEKVRRVASCLSFATRLRHKSYTLRSRKDRPHRINNVGVDRDNQNLGFCFNHATQHYLEVTK